MNRPVGLTLILLALRAPAGNAEAIQKYGIEPQTCSPCFIMRIAALPLSYFWKMDRQGLEPWAARL